MTDFIVTGFGPFLDVEYNPSWDCAQAFAAEVGVAAILLPVTFEAVRDAGRPTLLGDEPPVVVHFGVAATRDRVSLERFAHNWGKDAGDERAWRLVEGGHVAYESQLPLDEWAVDLNGAAGLVWEVSHCAGTYVCNATYYHTLAAFPGGEAVFVHVPDVPPDTAAEIGRRLARRLSPHETSR